MRYHALSIGAVFLALAIGVVLGSTGLSDRLVSAVSTERDDLAGQVTQLRAQRDDLAAQQRAADEFAARVGPSAVRGALPGKSVTLVSLGGDAADVAAVSGLVGQAGGTVAGQVRLTDAVTDPARADQLRELASRLLPAGAQLPAASDTGSLAGGLIGSALLTAPNGPATNATQAQAVLAGLSAAGFAEPGATAAPAGMVVVVTGGAAQGLDAADAAATTARLASELDRRGGGAVLAGRTGSADATGAIGVVRADKASAGGLSTVDDVQTGTGRVATILALREQAAGGTGQYGSAGDAAAPAPQP
nr:copper transporter [Pseudonocardia sp. KRD291]